MSLAGLLTIVDDDPQLHDVISRADYDPDPAAGASSALTGEDLVAAPTLRPVLAAALARAGPVASCSR